MNQNIRVEINGPVAEIVLNRPDQRNAVNSPLLDELLEAIRLIDADESVRVVLIRGAGPVFCAGNDLKERSTMSVDELRARRRKGQSIFAAIEQISKPCIAVVHGAAVAAGCEIAFASDFIIAGESASFRYPVGVRGSLGDALRLPRIAGKAVAKDLLFTGRLVEAREALSLRLVNHVVPDDRLIEFAHDMANMIAEHQPHAMTGIKRAIDSGTEADPESAARMEQEAIDAAIAFQGNRGRTT